MDNFMSEQVVPDVISSIPQSKLKVGASILFICVSSKTKKSVCLFVCLSIRGAAFRTSRDETVFLSVIVNVLSKVQWDGNDLEPGAQWTPTQVKDQPSVHWEAEDGALYTFIMTGRHWHLKNFLDFMQFFLLYVVAPKRVSVPLIPRKTLDPPLGRLLKVL